MVIEIHGQTKQDSEDLHSEFRHTVFIESDSMPDLKRAGELLQARWNAEFDPLTIKMEEIKEPDASGLKKKGVVTKI